MPEIHARRRERLAAALRERGADAALVSRLVNIYYLSGFTGSHAGLLVLADGRAVLTTDSRYQLQAGEEVPDVELVVDRRVATALVEHAAEHGATRIAFEAHDLTVEAHQQLADTADGGGAELVAGGRLVEDERAVKEEAELELLRAAGAITDWAFRHVVPTIRAGLTEREIAYALQERFVERGAESGFDPIVAAGTNSARPHHRPTDRALARGDLVVMDFGARYRGYHADMSRTIVLGEPTDWQREVYELVAAAQRAGREALCPGAELAGIDEAARAVIRDGGHDDAFTHGLGHGIGLEVHEQPYLGRSATGSMAAGVPVTVEPGVYLPGFGGVRIEDTLVAHAEGPELLTTASKDLLVL